MCSVFERIDGAIYSGNQNWSNMGPTLTRVDIYYLLPSYYTEIDIENIAFTKHLNRITPY